MTYFRKVIIEDVDGDNAMIDELGQLHVVLDGRPDENNSTTTPLAGDAVFTGAATDVSPYSAIIIMVNADEASADNGLVAQFSDDGLDWHSVESYTINANSDKVFTPPAFGNYFRIVYTNGSVAQTEFHLHVMLKKTPIKWSSHNINDPIKDEDDAELVKAVITGKQENGDFDNASLTNKGNFKVAVQEYGDTPSIDAFARLRVSEPFTLFDSKQLYDKQPLFWDESIGGTATSVHSTINAETLMTVQENTTDFVIRQTKQRINYQPGKSQLLFMTFRSPQNTGVVTRVGCFDGTGANNLTPNNGIFFQADGDVSWNIAKNGTTTETVTQANWNIDPLDGTGPSGISLDLDSCLIAIIDFEWLGVGRVRVGFVIDGIVRYVHYFNHANNSAYTSVYMSSPNLPLRYDIQGSGTNDAGTFAHICSTVISEGGQQKTGILRSIDTGTTHIDIDADQPTAIVGIRLKSTHLDLTVIPENISIINENNDDFRWSICLNPTISGGFAWTDVTNSGVQKGLGSTANNVTDEGIVVASGYASVDTLSVSQQLQTALRIGSEIDGTPDELILTVTPLSAGADIQGALSFRELL